MSVWIKFDRHGWPYNVKTGKQILLPGTADALISHLVEEVNDELRQWFVEGPLGMESYAKRHGLRTETLPVDARRKREALEYMIGLLIAKKALATMNPAHHGPHARSVFAKAAKKINQRLGI